MLRPLITNQWIKDEEYKKVSFEDDSLWNSMIWIIHNHKDQNIQRRASILLGQYNTAGGIMIKKEVEFFIREYKTK